MLQVLATAGILKFSLIVIGVGMLLAMALGAITLNADPTTRRLTTGDTAPENGHRMPVALASVDMTNPGPVIVDATQNAPSGNVKVIAAAGAVRDRYWGYAIEVAKAGMPLGVYRHVIVEGFVGCTPGSPVYIDATSADAGGLASGLSHTANGTPVGVALSATRIFFN